MIATDTMSENEWQQVAQLVTMSENEWYKIGNK